MPNPGRRSHQRQRGDERRVELRREARPFDDAARDRRRARRCRGSNGLHAVVDLDGRRSAAGVHDGDSTSFDPLRTAALRVRRIQPSHLEQLESERLDLLEHVVQLGLTPDRAAEYGLARFDACVEAREALHDAVSEAPADSDLVERRSHRARICRRSG